MSHALSKPTKSSLICLLTVIGCGLGSAACSGGHNPDRALEESQKTKAHVVGQTLFLALTNSNELLFSNEAASGTGRLVALKPLAQAESAQHFQFRFQLAPGGSLTLHANALQTSDTAGFDRSVALTFKRSESPSETALQVSLSAGGETDDWSSFFATLDARVALDIGVDVHNDHGGEAHVIVWNAADQNSLVELIDSGHDTAGTPGRGFGPYWGFDLTHATLELATVGAPRDAH
jgi:hypothetical protein